MRVLLDTHLLLWSAAASRRLPAEARALAEDPENEIYYSAASIWEVAIKSALGRRDFRVDIDAFTTALPLMGFSELPVTARHAAGVARLASIHRDPFDRLLIAQSVAEPLVLLTNDAVLTRYSDGVRLV